MPPRSHDPPALLVFIRGRWQSVPPGSRYAVVRRGKLQELRSGTVRSELRRFQMRLSSKARLGPRLPFKKIPPDEVNLDNDVTLLEPEQITIQNREVQPRKRTRDTTSPNEATQSVTTVATIHAAKQSKISKNHQLPMRLLSSQSKSSEESRIVKKKQTSKEIIESPKKSSVSTKTLLDSPKRSLSLRRKPVEYPSKQSSPILKSKDLSEKQISRYLQPRSEKQNKSPKMRVIVISNSDFETDRSEILKSKIKQNQSPKKIKSISNSNNQFRKIGPKRQKLDEDTLGSQSPKTTQNIFQRPKESNQTQKPEIGTQKELEIDEEDIDLLRTFLKNHYADNILMQFDADDEYKRMIFYRINPLVQIERCPLIGRMLCRSQVSQITLSDFALNLGLQSVTETASIKIERYKIRKRTEKSYVCSDSSSEDKENNDKMPRIIENTKILKERQHTMRESNIGENKAKESKNKVSNKRVLTRKRAESESGESNANENNKKAGNTKERAKPEKRNAVESDSESSKTDENNKKSGKDKEKAARKRAESESGESNANENKKKAEQRAKSANRNTVESDSEDSTTKENNKKDGNAKKQSKKEYRNTRSSNSQEINAMIVDQKEIDNTVEPSSESDKEKAVKAIKKIVKPKPVISSKRQRNKLEYSTGEDHAVVAWVSTGSRASRVNGNLLWRQLQDSYSQITGIKRTWHSLRNRYLRYILPKLGDLALPLSQQTRLRAAAATGELKAHKVRSPRRNSIFKQPVRGAASRRPAAVSDDAETENDELPSKGSPRYSSLTRQFARRHNLTRPSSKMSDTSSRSNYNKLEVKQDTAEPKENSPKKTHKVILPRKQINGQATGNKHSDSDRHESPRRDVDSRDSESDDTSKKINEPRRTRMSVNGANKQLSSDTRLNKNESKRRLTRQSNILYESDKSSSKSHGETDKPKSARKKTNESPRRELTRHKTPSEQTSSRDSSESMSEFRRKSPENNRRRSRRLTKNKDESDDESNESKRRKLPNSSISRSPMRKLKRNKSPSKQSSKGSVTSMSRVRRKSKSPIKRNNTLHDSSSEDSDSSRESVSQPRRKSNIMNSPKNRPNKRRSNRLISSMKQLSSDSSKRKSSRLTPNESNKKRRHSSESKRKSKLAKRDSLDEIVVSDSSESFETKKHRDVQKKGDPPTKKWVNKKKRRLFNPKDML